MDTGSIFLIPMVTNTALGNPNNNIIHAVKQGRAGASVHWDKETGSLKSAESVAISENKSAAVDPIHRFFYIS
ncbi:hypothetical protein [Paenibacillus thermotolerans]|uniref:hypothetical protein n=1 Tax=Paenibacillus thermotolerans TaxID=3027807 RepID=UPI002368D28D|nr:MULTISPECIES: hypothetical protein [unclassified Paenibacillus]